MTFLAAALFAAASSFAQTTSTAVSQETSAKATHGQTVSATAKTNVAGQTSEDGSVKGQEIKNAAQAKRAAAKEQQEKTKAEKREAKEAAARQRAETKTNVEDGLEQVREQKDTHGQQVSTTAQTTTATGKDKGLAVKQVATENKTARGARAETATGTTVKVKSSARRQTPTTARKTNVGSAPVKAKAGVRTGAGLKVGKN